jgi:AcrR family transcriptional regulator
MPAPAKFTRQQLQMAALRIVDEDGLPALTMRALAAVLGTGAMTIYNYFHNRDELEALLVEAVMSEVNLPAISAEDWRVDVRNVLTPVWRAIRAHPNVVPLILTRRTTHELTLEIGERLLGALASSGRSGGALLAAFRTLNAFVMGLAQSQLAASPATQGAAGASEDPHVLRAQMLPAHRFPRLREVAKAAAQTNSDREFHAGLDIILAGLAAKPTPPSRKRRGPARRGHPP